MPHQDQRYIEALLTNNKDLLDELYRKYSGKIKWMVLRNNGSVDDAADIFQDALLYIYHKARTEQFELACPFEAYLYLICKNKWLNELSKRRATIVPMSKVDISGLAEDSFRQADEDNLHEERISLLNEKVIELSESSQQVLQLSWSGKSMQEVAGQLRVSYGYARKKKSACITKLIKLVKESAKFHNLQW
jgi:RNA polymerase sigma factor (sigma-70 family)